MVSAKSSLMMPLQLENISLGGGDAIVEVNHLCSVLKQS